MQFLKNELKHAKEVKCCMDSFSVEYAEWHDYHQSFVWKTLSVAADYVLYDWEGRQHTAIADCKATRAVWHYLTIDNVRNRIDKIKAKKREQEEIKREVEDYLRSLKYLESHETRELYRKSDMFWMELIFHRKFTNTWPFNREGYLSFEEREEMYYKVFTGFSKKIQRELCRCKNKPAYRAKKDIPENLKTLNKINAPDWVLDKMTTVAYFLSKTGKTFYRLYDVNEIKKIKAEYPNRYESWEDVPTNLKSKTRIKKEHKTDVEKKGLKPVADVRMRTPYEVKYIPLYDVNKM
jgi:hypothetical protein